jgi:hypothetical protein
LLGTPTADSWLVSSSSELTPSVEVNHIGRAAGVKDRVDRAVFSATSRRQQDPLLPAPAERYWALPASIAGIARSRRGEVYGCCWTDDEARSCGTMLGRGSAQAFHMRGAVDIGTDRYRQPACCVNSAAWQEAGRHGRPDRFT